MTFFLYSLSCIELENDVLYVNSQAGNTKLKYIPKPKLLQYTKQK